MESKQVSQILKSVNEYVGEVAVPEDPPKLTFRAMRAILTYKTHLNKEEYISWFKTIAKNKVTFIRLAHETGDSECPYEHTHVLFELEKALQTTRARYFDYNDIHPHVRTLPNRKALEDAKNYIAKEDKDNKDLDRRNQMTLFQSISNCNTVGEVMEKYCTTPSDALGLKCMFDCSKGGPRLKRYSYEPDRPWQKELLKIIDTTPDPRTILWIYDYYGNTGKTALAKYLYVNDPTSWFISKDMGTSRDAATTIQNAIGNGWTAHGIIIDLPRQAENHERMYSYIEEIKDGFVTSQKYSGRTMAFDNPHVIVFANWKPKIECLSLDRWDIRFIKDGYLIQDKEEHVTEITTSGLSDLTTTDDLLQAVLRK